MYKVVFYLDYNSHGLLGFCQGVFSLDFVYISIEIVIWLITNHGHFWLGSLDCNQVLESDFYTRLESKIMIGEQVWVGWKYMDPCVKDKILNVEPSNWGHQCDRQMMRLVMEENDRAAPKTYIQIVEDYSLHFLALSRIWTSRSWVFKFISVVAMSQFAS